MFDYLFSLQLYADWATVALRIAIAVVFLVHGLGKWKLWKPQANSPMSAFLRVMMKILSVVEPLCAIAIALGFFTQVAAALLAITMLGAIYFKMIAWKVPFTSDTHTGWELDLTLLAICLALIIGGAGAISFDRSLYGL